jgi:hypothetical protein
MMKTLVCQRRKNTALHIQPSAGAHAVAGMLLGYYKK